MVLIFLIRQLRSLEMLRFKQDMGKQINQSKGGC